MNAISIKNTRGTLEERFLRRLQRQGECLVWGGSKNTSGYGQLMKADRTKVCTHRYSYERSFGPIPNGMVVDHTCHNKACVEPRHLRLATTKQNGENLRGPHARSTTGVLGVQRIKSRGKAGGFVGYRGRVVHNGKGHNTRLYETLAEAEAAVIALRLQLFTHNDLDRKITNYPT